MTFVPNDEQGMIVEALKRALRENIAASERQSRDSSAWEIIRDLGIFQIAIPELLDGFGGDERSMYLIAEVLGRYYVSSPILETLSASRILATKTRDERVGSVLSGISSGTEKIGIAIHGDGLKFDALAPGLRAFKSSGQIRLSGIKRFALCNQESTSILVSAIDPSGTIDVFMVDAKSPGISRKFYRAHDGRVLADIQFDAVDAVTLHPCEGKEISDTLLNLLATLEILQCGESVGATFSLLEATKSYAIERRQFRATLASFQTLRHRIADMAIAAAEARAIGLAAAEHVAHFGGVSAQRYVSAARAKVAKSGTYVSSQAIQIHGGMGMTDEMGIGRLALRIDANSRHFGNRAYQVLRYAAAPIAA